jgi:arsenate reductase
MAKSAPFNILFLCTGNSARSILAEGLLGELGAGRFGAFSAGSYPRLAPHPLALQLLGERGISTGNFRSKSWDEFAAPGAPHLHCVITVCDQAAGEPCPIWPGGPVAAHWGLPDPASATGSEAEVRAGFERVMRTLERRIKLLTALPVHTMDAASLGSEIQKLGDDSGAYE